ncbi:hypothetical protein BCR43DRAFT_564048 [Syncephalastrum racemosum]|uniref:RING-type domain-containing protein n=1 Tax=Syncephalastrum racemosum TaxID=13706 RepID=A0A1X2HDD3_SYNRA|nr:hypothetical protein BCR43DRAFT_564048 [Syncephalastrum racemosum]
MDSIRSDGRNLEPPKAVAHAWQDFAKQMTHKSKQKADMVTFTPRSQKAVSVEHTTAAHTGVAATPNDRPSSNPWKSYAQEECRLHRPLALPPKQQPSTSPPSIFPRSTSTSTSTSASASTSTSTTATLRGQTSDSSRRLSCSSERSTLSNAPSTILCFCQLPAAVSQTEEFGPILECHYSSDTADLTQQDGGVDCPRTICAFHLHKNAWTSIKLNYERGKYLTHEELRICPYFNSVACILLRTANDYPKRVIGAPKCYCNEAAIYSAGKNIPQHFYFYCTHCTFFAWASQAYILPRQTPVHADGISSPMYHGKRIDHIPTFVPSTITSSSPSIPASTSVDHTSPRQPSRQPSESLFSPKSVSTSPTREPQRALRDTLTQSEWDKENATIYASAAPRMTQFLPVRNDTLPNSSNPRPMAADFLRLLETARLPEMDTKATPAQDEKARLQSMLIPTSVLMQRSAKSGSNKADDLLRHEKQRKADARLEMELQRLQSRLQDLRAEHKDFSDRKHLRTELISRMKRDLEKFHRKYEQEVQKEQRARYIEEKAASSIELLENQLKSNQERRLRMEEYIEPYRATAIALAQEAESEKSIYREQVERDFAGELNCRVCHKPNADYALIPCFHIAYCRDCATKTDTCHVCKTIKYSIQKVYMA